jgi:hypothetical protein
VAAAVESIAAKASVPTSLYSRGKGCNLWILRRGRRRGFGRRQLVVQIWAFCVSALRHPSLLIPASRRVAVPSPAPVRPLQVLCPPPPCLGSPQGHRPASPAHLSAARLAPAELSSRTERQQLQRPTASTEPKTRATRLPYPIGARLGEQDRKRQPYPDRPNRGHGWKAPEALSERLSLGSSSLLSDPHPQAGIEQ